jgi:hypothetical protein
VDFSVRQLTAKEAAVVLREFRVDACSMQLLGWSCLAFGLLSAGCVPFAFAETEWLLAVCAAAMAVPLFLLARLILFGRRRRVAHGSPTLRAHRAEAFCETRKEGSGNRARRVNYVGSYRVALRAGWGAFWPDGQVAEVELCFPEGFSLTHFSAAVVALPGIDIGRWLRRPPPSRAGFWWSFGCAVVGGVFTVVSVLELLRGERLEQAAGPETSLVWLVAALGLSSVVSGVAAATLQRRYQRDLQRWAEAIRRDALEP